MAAWGMSANGIKSDSVLEEFTERPFSFLEGKAKDARKVVERLERMKVIVNSEKWSKTVLEKIIQIINSDTRNL